MLTKLSNLVRNLLSESGELSMTRFLSLICVVAAVILAFYGIHESKHSLESLAVLCGTFLGAGLGAKVMQRKFENGDGTSEALSQIETRSVEVQNEKE